MLIGLDIDGVLFSWEDASRAALVEQFGIPWPGPSLTWTWLKDECLEPEQWRWLWSAEGQEVVFGQIDRTYPGAVEMVEALTRPPENRVHFVTHRDPRRAGLNTARFLREHFGAHPWAGVHVLQNDVRKAGLARWDVFVDDKPETVFDFLANTGAQVFSPVRPWNMDELGDVDDPRLIHYDDPAEVVAWVNGSL